MKDNVFTAPARLAQFARLSLTVCALTIAVPLMLAVAAAAGSAPRPAGADHAHRHADAMQTFASQRYADAYGRFAQLADEGDASSALMALMLVCEGPSLFGSEWSATPGQLQRWSAMAVQHVRERALLIPQHERGE